MAKQAIITQAELGHSKVACYRVEDAILGLLLDQKLTPRSPASAIIPALRAIAQSTPPAWCSTEAWAFVARRMAIWARVYRSLELWSHLRRVKHYRAGAVALMPVDILTDTEEVEQ